jgi:hypothetical protein
LLITRSLTTKCFIYNIELAYKKFLRIEIHVQMNILSISKQETEMEEKS